MKIVTELTAQANEVASLALPDGVSAQVSEEVAKGFYRSTKLGRDGLVLKRGAHQVFIPLGVLWAMANTVEPQLVPVPPEKEVEPMPAQPV
jgi:hypothetical protein